MATKISEVLGFLPALKLIRAWKASAGPVLLKQARFQGLRNEHGVLTLCLQISDPLWRQELLYQRSSILKAFNEALLKEGFTRDELPRACSFGASAALPIKTVDPKKRWNKEGI